MFDGVVIKLLEGRFICNTTEPDLFEYLKTEGARHEIDGYLGRIDRRLESTPNGQAYYAAYARIGKADRREIRDLFGTIKHEIKPVLAFLNFAMQATHADKTLFPGDVLDFPTLLKTVSDNPHLGEELRKFPSLGKEFVSSDSNVRSMLDRILQQIVKSGYLVQDRENDRYQVTGKIDYFYEVMDFLAENENIEDSTEKEPEAEMGRLI